MCFALETHLTTSRIPYISRHTDHRHIVNRFGILAVRRISSLCYYYIYREKTCQMIFRLFYFPPFLFIRLFYRIIRKSRRSIRTVSGERAAFRRIKKPVKLHGPFHSLILSLVKITVENGYLRYLLNIELPSTTRFISFRYSFSVAGAAFGATGFGARFFCCFIAGAV